MNEGNPWNLKKMFAGKQCLGVSERHSRYP